MYIAMNRFRIVPGSEESFEAVWRNRETRLEEVDGFVSFHLLKGAASETHTLYASHTMWRDEASFLAWTRSEQFRAAHKDAGSHKALYLEAPVFEGFTVVDA